MPAPASSHQPLVPDARAWQRVAPHAHLAMPDPAAPIYDHRQVDSAPVNFKSATVWLRTGESGFEERMAMKLRDHHSQKDRQARL